MGYWESTDLYPTNQSDFKTLTSDNLKYKITPVATDYRL